VETSPQRPAENQTAQAARFFTFLSHLVFGLVCLLLPCGAQAFDRRTPIHLLPEGWSSLEVIGAATRTESRQLNVNGDQVATLEGAVYTSKIIARQRAGRRWEFGVEIPYFLDKEKTVTTALGEVRSHDENEGLGDVSLTSSFCWLESRSGGLGLITGVDIKAPSGDANRDLGTGAWDAVLRTALSYRTPVGFPFLQGTYTWTGHGESHGVDTDEGDELDIAAGLKSRFWHGLGFQASGFYAFLTEKRTRETGGKEVVFAQYRTYGFFLALRYQPHRKLEIDLFHKSIYHHDEDVNIGGTPFTLDTEPSRRFGMMLKYFW